MNIPNDPVILELIEEFVDTWIVDIDNDFKRLVETKNSDDLYRLAHTLKGSCFQFGLDDIAHLGIELMDKAKAKEWDLALEYEQPLREKFAEVKSFLKK